MGYILVGSLTRLKTLVYQMNGAKCIKVYIKHNGELNPRIVPSVIPPQANDLEQIYIQPFMYCQLCMS